jgi:hypothetical protein
MGDRFYLFDFVYVWEPGSYERIVCVIFTEIDKVANIEKEK